MKTITLTASEIRSLEHYLFCNPCGLACVYDDMINSGKDCEECRLNIDRNSILDKLDLL